MQELTFEQVEEVSGGVLPRIVAGVVADAGLIAAMVGSGLWKPE